MEKHLLTALLLLVLVAPQTGLEAKSRHHGVKDRDNDAEERDHEDKKRYHKSKNRYHKSKKRHHKSKKHHHSWRKFIRLARATKAELELLKQSIAEMNAKMKALEPQAQLPGDLAEQVDANTSAIGDNTSAIGDNTSEITMALDETIVNAAEIDGLNTAVTDLGTRLDALVLRVDDHETRIAALESPPFSGVRFSRGFTQGEAPNPLTKEAWGIFIDSIDIATGDFKSIEITNNLGGRAFCSDSKLSTNIASLLKNFIPNDPTVSVSCDGRSWNIGHFGDGAALSAGGSINVNDCANNATVRPFINHENWGGIGTTCGAIDQNLEVILTR